MVSVKPSWWQVRTSVSRAFGRACDHLTYPKPPRQPGSTGGVQVLTGVSLTYFTVAALFSGTGEMTVLAGTYGPAYLYIQLLLVCLCRLFIVGRD